MCLFSVLNLPALRLSQRVRSQILETFSSEDQMKFRKRIGLPPDDYEDLTLKCELSQKTRLILSQTSPMTFEEMFISLFAVCSTQLQRVSVDAMGDFQAIILKELRSEPVEADEVDTQDATLEASASIDGCDESTESRSSAADSVSFVSGTDVIKAVKSMDIHLEVHVDVQEAIENFIKRIIDENPILTGSALQV